jgi:hypothetical protein
VFEVEGRLKLVFSYEISSDDEGILMTITSETRQNILKVLASSQEMFSRIKMSVDKLFGIRTSFAKSTLSISSVFEFNSQFWMRNTIASALIKFMSVCCDDTPEESLHNRIAGMYDSLRSVRENGGSGFLCHWVSICQAIAFNMNLGVGRMDWLGLAAWKRVMAHKLSHLGFYTIADQVTAGLVSTQFYNWRACRENEETCRVYSTLVGPAVDKAFESDDSYALTYGMFPRTKFKAMLSRKGLFPLVDGKVNFASSSSDFFSPFTGNMAAYNA